MSDDLIRAMAFGVPIEVGPMPEVPREDKPFTQGTPLPTGGFSHGTKMYLYRGLSAWPEWTIEPEDT